MIKTLGTPEITDQLKQTIVDGVSRIAGNRSVDQLAQTENRELLRLIKLRAKNGSGSLKEIPTNNKSPESNGDRSERVFFLDASGGRIEQGA
jgi:hypothetical protein